MRDTACTETPSLIAPSRTEWPHRGWLITATHDAASGLHLVTITASGMTSTRRVGTAVTLAMGETMGRASIDHRIRQIGQAFDRPAVSQLEAGMMGGGL